MVPARDASQLDGFVERFAATLAEGGMPPLAARVFATLLASEEGRLTAVELAERLHASTGGVSGAVRYLVQVRMIRREREPGTRRHSYVADASWYDAVVSANPILVKGEADLRDGIALLGDSAAAARLAETLELIQFLKEESEAMMRRWRERRAGPSPSDTVP